MLITEGLNVRNGASGDGKNAFISLADLSDSSIATGVANVLAEPIASALMRPGLDMGAVTSVIYDVLRNSPAWRSQFARIDRFMATADIPGSAAANLLAEVQIWRAAMDAEIALRAAADTAAYDRTSGVITELASAKADLLSLQNRYSALITWLNTRGLGAVPPEAV